MAATPQESQRQFMPVRVVNTKLSYSGLEYEWSGEFYSAVSGAEGNIGLSAEVSLKRGLVRWYMWAVYFGGKTYAGKEQFVSHAFESMEDCLKKCGCEIADMDTFRALTGRPTTY